MEFNIKGYDSVKVMWDYLVEESKKYDRYLTYSKVVISEEGLKRVSCKSVDIILEILLCSIKYTFSQRYLKGYYIDKVRWESPLGAIEENLFKDIVSVNILKAVWDKKVVVRKTIEDFASQLMKGEEAILAVDAGVTCRIFNIISVVYSSIVDCIYDNMESQAYKEYWMREAINSRKREVIGILSYGEVKVAVEEVTEEKENIDPLEELNSLVGLKTVKEDVKTLINLVKVQQKRKEVNLKANEMSLHMVFTGNPGTGKTTVARLIAKVYNKIGVLSKGTFVEVSREDLVAGYVGHSALKTKKVLEKARGGVLFIDEAYALDGAGENDFGGEVISTILKDMEDNRGDLVVIMAGYPDLMESLLKSNPGLKSRFNKFINFDDYSEEELEEIYELISKKEGYTIEVGIKPILKKKLAEVKDGGNFANARTVRNIFEKSLANQANRIVEADDFSLGSLQLIKAEDVESVVDTSKKENKKTIGFGGTV